MLGRVKLSTLIRLLPAAALATGLVCALEALSGAAAGADAGGEPAPVPPGPVDAAAPPPSVIPDGGSSSRAERHKLRRFRKQGGILGAVDGGITMDAARPMARDGGIFQMGFPRPPPPPPPVAPTPPPAPPPPVPSGPTALPITPDQPFNSCQKIPSGKRVVKVNLKPEVELPELIAWISSVTCKAFVL